MYLFSFEYGVLIIAFLLVTFKMVKIRKKGGKPDKIDLFSKS